jgi:hypothetical protein
MDKKESKRINETKAVDVCTACTKPNEYFVYFDQRYTSGADIALPNNASASDPKFKSYVLCAGQNII